MGEPRDHLIEKLSRARLYLCTDARRERGDLAEFADAVLAGGVDIIQLRDKGSPGEQRFGALGASAELAALEILTDAAGRHNIYGDVVASFRLWWVSGFYILAMAFLGLHLFHGAWSSLRTLGVARPSEHPMHRRIAAVVAIAVWLGFTLVPLGVLAGIVH